MSCGICCPWMNPSSFSQLSLTACSRKNIYIFVHMTIWKAPSHTRLWCPSRSLWCQRYSCVHTQISHRFSCLFLKSLYVGSRPFSTCWWTVHCFSMKMFIFYSARNKFHHNIASRKILWTIVLARVQLTTSTLYPHTFSDLTNIWQYENA